MSDSDNNWPFEGEGEGDQQSYNWQGSASVQHELRQNVGLNIAYYRTWYGGFLASDNLATPAGSYNSYCITIPIDSRLPNSGQPLCGLYDVTPALAGQQDNLVTQATHYGAQTEVFQGVDVTVTGRFAQGARAQASLSTGQTVNDTILNEQTRYSNTNNQFMNAIQIMGGRLIKFSAQLTF